MRNFFKESEWSDLSIYERGCYSNQWHNWMMRLQLGVGETPPAFVSRWNQCKGSAKFPISHRRNLDQHWVPEEVGKEKLEKTVLNSERPSLICDNCKMMFQSQRLFAKHELESACGITDQGIAGRHLVQMNNKDLINLGLNKGSRIDILNVVSAHRQNFPPTSSVAGAVFRESVESGEHRETMPFNSTKNTDFAHSNDLSPLITTSRDPFLSDDSNAGIPSSETHLEDNNFNDKNDENFCFDEPSNDVSMFESGLEPSYCGFHEAEVPRLPLSPVNQLIVRSVPNVFPVHPPASATLTRAKEISEALPHSSNRRGDGECSFQPLSPIARPFFSARSAQQDRGIRVWPTQHPDKRGGEQRFLALNSMAHPFASATVTSAQQDPATQPSSSRGGGKQHFQAPSSMARPFASATVTSAQQDRASPVEPIQHQGRRGGDQRSQTPIGGSCSVLRGALRVTSSTHPSCSDDSHSSSLIFLNSEERVGNLIEDAMRKMCSNFNFEEILPKFQSGSHILSKLKTDGFVSGTNKKILSRILTTHILTEPLPNMSPVDMREEMAITLIKEYPLMRKRLLMRTDRPWHHWYNATLNTVFFLENSNVGLQRNEKKITGKGIRKCKATPKAPRKLVSLPTNHFYDSVEDPDPPEFIANVLEARNLVATVGEKANILYLMEQTFERRRHQLNFKELTTRNILAQYPHFLSYNGEVIEHEFNLMQPNSQRLFLRTYQSNYAPKLMKIARDNPQKYFDCHVFGDDDVLNSLLVFAEVVACPKKVL